MHDAEAEKEFQALLKKASKIEGDSSDDSDLEWRPKNKVSENETEVAVEQQEKQELQLNNKRTKPKLQLNNKREVIEGHGRLSRHEARELKRALEDSKRD